jgi:RNA polymerase sigma-70 factor (ECF subfamily)
MVSQSADRVELFAGSPETQAVTDISVANAADDSQLVEAARRGDRAAFGRLYDLYARMVHGILLARVPLSEVDDLVQDVFLLALPRLHSLRDATRFGGWLAAIARNRANDYHRQKVDQVELADEFSQDNARPLEGPNEMGAAFILGVIRNLPETYRETLLLRLVEGMTGPEIAARTGMTPGSVRVNLHRGMQQLREKLAHKDPG